MSVNRETLAAYLNDQLEIDKFRDYCPNGLQVQGRPTVERIATGVTASLAFLEAACAWGADTVIVHHGYFWRNEAPQITGGKYRRLRMLLINDINLFAYHLPLDAHPTLGNNAQLGRRFGWLADSRFGENDLGWLAPLSTPVSLHTLIKAVEVNLGRQPLVFGAPDKVLRRIAWCTGAAQNLFGQAIAAGADAYLSGEVCEPTMHLAHESGVAYLAAGHHATERFGVQALGAHLAEHFGIAHQFIDIENPV